MPIDPSRKIQNPPVAAPAGEVGFGTAAVHAGEPRQKPGNALHSNVAEGPRQRDERERQGGGLEPNLTARCRACHYCDDLDEALRSSMAKRQLVGRSCRSLG